MITFGEIEKTIKEFLAQNKDTSVDDVADMLFEKQEEWGIPDEDLGILLYSIGAKERFTAPIIKALEEKGILAKDNTETETDEKEEEKPTPVPATEEKTDDKDDKEKEEVRKMFNGEK